MVNAPACTFKFYRHATAVLTLGRVKLLIDPMYRQARTLPPIPSVMNLRRNPLEVFPEPVPGVSREDIVVITHHHFDHFDRPGADTLHRDVSIVTPLNGIRRLKRWGFVNLFPLQAGGRVSTRGVEFEAVPVRHAERWPKLLYKSGLGYLIRGENRTAYISGDTVLFDRLLGRLKGVAIDLAVLYGGGARIPVLGRHTFSHREVLGFVSAVRPELTVVTHLGCLNHCPETGRQLEEMLKAEPADTDVRIATPGQEYAF